MSKLEQINDELNQFITKLMPKALKAAKSDASEIKMQHPEIQSIHIVIKEKEDDQNIYNFLEELYIKVDDKKYSLGDDIPLPDKAVSTLGEFETDIYLLSNYLPIGDHTF